jgi:hypothetical protein
VQLAYSVATSYLIPWFHAVAPGGSGGIIRADSREFGHFRLHQTPIERKASTRHNNWRAALARTVNVDPISTNIYEVAEGLGLGLIWRWFSGTDRQQKNRQDFIKELHSFHVPNSQEDPPQY